MWYQERKNLFKYCVLFACKTCVLCRQLHRCVFENVCESGAGDPRRGENAEHVMCWCQCHDISHIFVQIAGHQLSSQVSGPVRNCKQWTVSWEPGSWPSWPPHTDHEDWRNSSFCRKEVFWNKSEMKLNDMVREIGQLTFSVDITSYNNNHLQVSSSSPSDYHQQHRRRSCDFCLLSLYSGIVDFITIYCILLWAFYSLFLCLFLKLQELLYPDPESLSHYLCSIRVVTVQIGCFYFLCCACLLLMLILFPETLWQWEVMMTEADISYSTVSITDISARWLVLSWDQSLINHLNNSCNVLYSSCFTYLTEHQLVVGQLHKLWIKKN